jgi:hypothetical protein
MRLGFMAVLADLSNGLADGADLVRSRSLKDLSKERVRLLLGPLARGP